MFGLEADTANGWAPYRASYATSGYIPLSAISDSLFAVNDEGETVPLLVESVDHNADYTEWTLHIREGITFHDGTPLDGAAVKFNIDANRASPLTAGALTPIDTVTASGQDVVITIKGGPWVALPNYLTYGSIGYVLSPTWLASLPDVPQRTEGGPVYDAAVAATPADGDPAEAGRARGVQVRVVHAGQRQRLPRRAQRGLLARPERHHGRGPALPRRHRGCGGGGHRQPPERPCARASSTPCTPPTPTPSASSSTTTASRSRRPAATATRRTT